MLTATPELPVVCVATRDGYTCLDSSDYEFHDYLDDYLVEKCGINCLHVDLTNDSPHRYSLVVPQDITPEAVVAAVAKLLAGEAQRTFILDCSCLEL